MLSKSELEEINLSDFIEIDVPADGSCLFWCIALSVLLPKVNNAALFSQVFLQIFGEDNRESIKQIRLLLSDYDHFPETIYTNKRTVLQKLTQLIQVKFRGKIVEYLREHPDDFLENTIDHASFNEFLTDLAQPTYYGGQEVIEAASQMLGVQIQVFQKQANATIAAVTHGEESPSIIHLINMAYDPSYPETKNHYHFFVNPKCIKNIYDINKLWRENIYRPMDISSILAQYKMVGSQEKEPMTQEDLEQYLKVNPAACIQVVCCGNVLDKVSLIKYLTQDENKIGTCPCCRDPSLQVWRQLIIMNEMKAPLLRDIFVSIPGLICEETTGHGLYHAVATCLGKTEVVLRTKTVTCMESNVNKFQTLHFPEQHTLESCITAMRHGQEWPHYFEIELLMQVLDRPILIIQPNGEIENLFVLEKFTKQTVECGPIFLFVKNNRYYAALREGRFSTEEILTQLKQYAAACGLSALDREDVYGVIEIAIKGKTEKQYVKALIDFLQINWIKDLNQSSVRLLFYTIYVNNMQALQILLYFGAKPNLTNGLMNSPLYVAVEQANVQAVKLLVAHGALLDMQCHRGTPRTWVQYCMLKVKEAKQTLLEHIQYLEQAVQLLQENPLTLALKNLQDDNVVQDIECGQLMPKQLLNQENPYSTVNFWSPTVQEKPCCERSTAKKQMAVVFELDGDSNFSSTQIFILLVEAIKKNRMKALVDLLHYLDDPDRPRRNRIFSGVSPITLLIELAEARRKILVEIDASIEALGKITAYFNGVRPHYTSLDLLQRSVGNQGRSILHQACLSCNEEGVVELVQIPGMVTLRDTSHHTPLMLLAGLGHFADSAHSISLGNLSSLFSRRNLKIWFDLLIKEKFINRTEHHRSSQQVVRIEFKLTQKFYQTEAQLLKDPRFPPAFICALSTTKFDFIFEQLCKYSSTSDLADLGSHGALHLAWNDGCLNMRFVALFLRKGVHLREDFLQRLTHSSLLMLMFLMKELCDLNRTASPLHVAIQFFDQELFFKQKKFSEFATVRQLPLIASYSSLLAGMIDEFQVDVNACDSRGESAIFVAIRLRKMKIVQTLVDNHHASLLQLNSDNEFPLDIVDDGDNELSAFLLGKMKFQMMQTFNEKFNECFYSFEKYLDRLLSDQEHFMDLILVCQHFKFIYHDEDQGFCIAQDLGSDQEMNLDQMEEDGESESESSDQDDNDTGGDSADDQEDVAQMARVYYSP